MNRILKIAQTEIEYLGLRPLTESDFYRECEKRSIEVIIEPLFHCDGITFWLRGRLIIAIASQLTGSQRLRVMWHEFGHAIFHIPNVTVGAWFCGLEHETTQEEEKEVEEFVVVAMGESPER